MPTPLMKTFAKEAGKKTKTVEKIWKTSEKLVKEKYNIDEEDDRFYPLVVGVVKNKLGIRRKEMVKEDGEPSGEVADSGGMTTTSMGDYQFAPRLGQIVTFPVMQIKYNKPKKKRSSKKRIKKLKESCEENGHDFDSDISSILYIYQHKFDNDEEVIEEAIDFILRYYGIEPSIFDEIKE